jgi:hypothetical protein
VNLWELEVTGRSKGRLAGVMMHVSARRRAVYNLLKVNRRAITQVVPQMERVGAAKERSAGAPVYRARVGTRARARDENEHDGRGTGEGDQGRVVEARALCMGRPGQRAGSAAPKPEYPWNVRPASVFHPSAKVQ